MPDATHLFRKAMPESCARADALPEGFNKVATYDSAKVRIRITENPDGQGQDIEVLKANYDVDEDPNRCEIGFHTNAVIVRTEDPEDMVFDVFVAPSQS